MNRNTTLRLLVFFLGIPLLAVGAFIGRDAGLPVFGALVVTASAMAAREAALFFPASVRAYPGSVVLIPLIGAVVPFVGYLEAVSGAPATLVVPVVTIGSAIIMALQLLRQRAADISLIVPVVSAHLFLLVYPGLFAWHAARLVTLPASSELIVLFFLSVYLNDSLAWLFGRLFARPRPSAVGPLVPISPNKSLVGFVAGFLTSVAVIVLAGVLFPEVLPGTVGMHLVFGVVIGAVSIIGDLVESGFKRSAAVKDSGNVIPGRGGLLDSIDSAMYAAPFFFWACVILLHA